MPEQPELHAPPERDDATRPSWIGFCDANHRRRAVRDFDGTPIDEAAMRAILGEALLAPSSGNLQPYQLHWLRDPQMKARVAQACEAQRAAASAATLVVVVASRGIATRTAAQQLEHVEHSTALDAKSKAYYRAQLRKFSRFLRLAPLLAPLRLLLSLIHPASSLLPLGAGGVRHWTARSGIYAAQTLMLAASARGIDSCPMEGFNAAKVARLLGVPRGAVLPIVIALGYRREGARIEPRWRRPIGDAVIEHNAAAQI